ncbi:hypothetical protein Salat_2427100 [Sesamum alatum]|uniref:Uncharacterized protein n=1 Tax=Sesamum alatum TaxID=300844 RepID=A0AAE1XY95_9LAMI|nr:hypothetical protein Salat_2427100 [Sesamum alatum]
MDSQKTSSSEGLRKQWKAKNDVQTFPSEIPSMPNFNLTNPFDLLQPLRENDEHRMMQVDDEVGRITQPAQITVHESLSTTCMEIELHASPPAEMALPIQVAVPHSGMFSHPSSSLSQSDSLMWKPLGDFFTASVGMFQQYN